MTRNPAEAAADAASTEVREIEREMAGSRTDADLMRLAVARKKRDAAWRAVRQQREELDLRRYAR